MRNVTIVVPVLITSCHVSEYRNAGPVRTQTMITVAAALNAQLLPAYFVAFSEIRSSCRLIGCAMRMAAHAAIMNNCTIRTNLCLTWNDAMCRLGTHSRTGKFDWHLTNYLFDTH